MPPSCRCRSGLRRGGRAPRGSVGWPVIGWASGSCSPLSATARRRPADGPSSAKDKRSGSDGRCGSGGASRRRGGDEASCIARRGPLRVYPNAGRGSVRGDDPSCLPGMESAVVVAKSVVPCLARHGFGGPMSLPCLPEHGIVAEASQDVGEPSKPCLQGHGWSDFGARVVRTMPRGAWLAADRASIHAYDGACHGTMGERPTGTPRIGDAAGSWADEAPQ